MNLGLGLGLSYFQIGVRMNLGLGLSYFQVGVRDEFRVRVRVELLSNSKIDQKLAGRKVNYSQTSN